MKITKRLLKSLGCCESGIYKFINTPELHDINNLIKFEDSNGYKIYEYEYDMDNIKFIK